MQKQQIDCICNLKQIWHNFYAIKDLFIAYFRARNFKKKSKIYTIFAEFLSIYNGCFKQKKDTKTLKIIKKMDQLLLFGYKLIKIIVFVMKNDVIYHLLDAQG
eukprot:UN07456